MPIQQFLNGENFDRETTHAMGVAFEIACVALQLRGRSDPATTAAVEDFGSDPSRVPARIYICLRASVTTLPDGVVRGCPLAGGRLSPPSPELQSRRDGRGQVALSGLLFPRCPRLVPASPSG
jgi:hypothetical protein